jgi:prophage regulatory protein
MSNSKDNRTGASADKQRSASTSSCQGSVQTWAERWFRLSRESNESAAKEGRNADRMLTRREVREITGVAYSSMYVLINRGQFPPPRRIGARSSRWLESEIQAWISTRPVASARAERT